MNAQRTPVGWGLWLRWVLATIVGGAVGSAMYGAITGAALVWLLRQPRPEASTG